MDWENWLLQGHIVPGGPSGIFAMEKDTEFPVKRDWIGGAGMNMVDVNQLCDECSDCQVRMYTLLAGQLLSFDVSGFSTDPVRTTLGACSCSDSSEDQCWNANAYCEYPTDRGWDTAVPAELMQYEYDAENFAKNSNTCRTQEFFNQPC